MNYKDIAITTGIGFISMLLLSIPLGSLSSMIILSFGYVFFMYLPFVPLAEKLEDISFVQKYVLINVVGLSYAGLYLVLDIIFNIPLAKITYIIVTLLIACVLWYTYIKRK